MMLRMKLTCGDFECMMIARCILYLFTRETWWMNVNENENENIYY